MRIVHLTASRFFGGPERQILALSARLRACAEVRLLSYSEGGRCRAFLGEAARRGLDVAALRFDTPHLPAMVRELRAILREAPETILCTHGYKANLVGLLAARRADTPVIAVSRGWTGENRRVRLYEALDRQLLPLVDRVVCVSRAQADKVARLGVPPGRIDVIHNCVELNPVNNSERRADLTRLFSTPPEKIVCAAGRLSPEKGFDVLVAAAAAVARRDPSVGFVLFGEGPERAALQQRIAAAGLEGRFILAGHRHSVRELFAGADLLALSSFTEGLPNVVLEAFAGGVPVVASAVGGVPELVEDGVNGRLVPPGDAEALANGIVQVLGNAKLRPWLGAAGLKKVVREFSFEAQTAKYLKLFREVLRPIEPRPAPPSRAHQPLRVCFMIDNLHQAGTEALVLSLVKHLDRDVVEPCLCLLDGEKENSRRLEPRGCEVIRLGVRSLARPSAVAKLLQLRRFLRARAIDVVHCFFPDSIAFGALAARLAGVRLVLRSRNNLGYGLSLTHRILGRLGTRLVHASVTNCEAGRQSILMVERPAPESVHVLAGGVDLERFRDVPSYRPGSPRTVGVVANLRPIKNLGLFIQAAADLADAHPDLRFEIAGEGPQRWELEELIRRRGLERRVTLAGACANVPEFLSRLEVAVLCSDSEGMSNALLEYMAAGRPIVATDVGANAELVEDGVHGRIVPAGDRAALAGAIDGLLRDPALSTRLGAAARERVREHYSLEAMVRRYQQFYLELATELAASRGADSPFVSRAVKRIAIPQAIAGKWVA